MTFLQSSSSILLSHTLNSHSCIINHVTQQEDIQYCITQSHAAIKENASSLFVQTEIIIHKTGNFGRRGYRWVVMIFSTLPPFSHCYVCRDWVLRIIVSYTTDFWWCDSCITHAYTQVSGKCLLVLKWHGKSYTGHCN